MLEDPNTGVKVFESAAVSEYLLRKYDQDRTLGPIEASPGKAEELDEKKRQELEQERAEYDTWIHVLVAGLAAQVWDVLRD